MQVNQQCSHSLNTTHPEKALQGKHLLLLKRQPCGRLRLFELLKELTDPQSKAVLKLPSVSDGLKLACMMISIIKLFQGALSNFLMEIQFNFLYSLTDIPEIDFFVSLDDTGYHFLSSSIESYTETLSACLYFFVFRVPIYLNGGFSAGTGLNGKFPVFAHEPHTFLAQSL